MEEKEIVTILSAEDNLAKISLLQKLVKTQFNNCSINILTALKALSENKDMAVRFWAKKVYSSLKPTEEIAYFETITNEDLSIEFLLQKLATAQSHFIANEVLAKIFIKRDSSAFKPLVEYLKSCSDCTVIAFLVKNLSVYFPDENTLSVIVPYLKNKDDRVVANCIEGLGYITSPKATVLINQMLAHENHRIRANAAKALANKDPVATKKVIRFMLQAKDKPHFVIAGCHAASHLKSAEFLPDLAEIVANPLFSDSALNAIMAIGGESSIGYLEALAEIDDHEVKNKVLQTIKGLKGNSNLQILSNNLAEAIKSSKEGLVSFGKTIMDKAKEVSKETKPKENFIDDGSSEFAKWFYVLNGERTGPFSEQEIKSAIAVGSISENTKVWNGEGDWKEARLTSLSNLFPKKEDTLPPLSGEDVDNRFAWLIVAIPLIGLFIELMAGRELLKVYILLNVCACLLDAKKLKSAGHEAPNTFWAMIIPLYLWQRATILKQRRSHFYGWLIAFFLSILLTTGINYNLLEESACPLVSQILKEKFGSTAAVCKAVKISEEVSGSFYKGIAYLNNGNELKITIEKKENDQIFVTIPYQ